MTWWLARAKDRRPMADPRQDARETCAAHQITK